MDITDTTERRFTVGIEALLDGRPVSFDGFRFWREGEVSLHIDSFSDWEPKLANLEMAKEEIRHAKEAYQILCSRSALFHDATTSLAHQYCFCYDYGQGSIELAREENGKVVWTFEASDG